MSTPPKPADPMDHIDAAIRGFEAGVAQRRREQAEDDAAHAWRKAKRKAEDARALERIAALKRLRAPVEQPEAASWEETYASRRPLSRFADPEATWTLERPRGGSQAIKRAAKPGTTVESLGGLRRVGVEAMLAAGEEGLTVAELADEMLRQAPAELSGKFQPTTPQAVRLKNTGDLFYFVRKVQDVLGVRVERRGRRWRVLPVNGTAA